MRGGQLTLSKRSECITALRSTAWSDSCKSVSISHLAQQSNSGIGLKYLRADAAAFSSGTWTTLSTIPYPVPSATPPPSLASASHSWQTHRGGLGRAPGARRRPRLRRANRHADARMMLRPPTRGREALQWKEPCGRTERSATCEWGRPLPRNAGPDHC